jgi:protein-tyrosine-phosphatase
MSIVFVCNQNLARSQTLFAYFSSVLTSEEFHCLGLIAHENGQLPSNIIEILRDWGLPFQNLRAKNLYQHLDIIASAEYIFCLSDLISEMIKNLGFKGKVVNLEDLARNMDIQISDPQLIPRNLIEFELAKILRVATQAMRDIGKLPINNLVMAIIPRHESQVNRKLLEDLTLRYPRHLIFYGDIVAPKVIENLAQSVTYEYVQSGKFFSLPSDCGNAKFLIPKHSVEVPNSIYLGNIWRNLLDSFIDRQIVIVPPPLYTGFGVNASSYLASLQFIDMEILEPKS